MNLSDMIEQLCYLVVRNCNRYSVDLEMEIIEMKKRIEETIKPKNKKK